MRINAKLLTAIARASLLLFLMAAGFVQVGHTAPGYTDFAVIKPVTPCADLAKADLSKVADTPGTVKSAELVDTPKGQFCKVVAEFEPMIDVTVNLPVDLWTQRYVMSGGGGGAPGPNGYVQAGTCTPAL